jgi:hypothetical protein
VGKYRTQTNVVNCLWYALRGEEDRLRLAPNRHPAFTQLYDSSRCRGVYSTEKIPGEGLVTCPGPARNGTSLALRCQPGVQLRLLSLAQLDAGIDAVNRFGQRAVRRVDLVGGEEAGDLVPALHRAERSD